MENSLHIHLDAVGGVAGDMFIAAIVDAFPHMADTVRDAIETADDSGLINCEFRKARTNSLCGLGFHVSRQESAEINEPSHVSFAKISKRIADSTLEPDIKTCATDIFRILAEAEAYVHGAPVDEVSFHEVGAWDSIADIVGAAALITKLSASWSISILPQGRGTVSSRHGILPVPAPAVTRILRGYVFADDGFAGERVTPTGAAIIRHIDARQESAIVATPRKLLHEGYGVGGRAMPEFNNVLRALVFSELSSSYRNDRIGQIIFNIDDQTQEDLAIALDNIRAEAGVLDVVQVPCVGKKGRMTMQVQVLTSAEQLDSTVAVCFHETTTLGVRTQYLDRTIIPRQSKIVRHGDKQVRIKSAERDGVVTTKMEADELRGIAGGASGRQIMRDEVEANGADD